MKSDRHWYLVPDGRLRRVLDDTGQFVYAGMIERSIAACREARLSNNDHLAGALVAAPDGGAQEDRFAWTRAFTSGWRNLAFPGGLGPVRTLYHLNLCLSPFHDADRLSVGGFPPPFFPVRYSDPALAQMRDAEMRMRDWVVHDMYLGGLLGDLGLTWMQVEDAVAGAFLLNLPPKYQTLLTGLPDWSFYLVWKNDIERWMQSKGHRAKLLKAIDGLEGLVSKVPEEAGDQAFIALRKLREFHQQPWAVPERGAMNIEGELAARCRASSPVNKAVIKAVYETLWVSLNVESTAVESTPSLAAARSIWEHRRENDEVRPRALWMLIADIVNHLPIARGLPFTPHRQSEAPAWQLPTPSPLSHDAVRQIVTEQYDRTYYRSRSTRSRSVTGSRP